MYIPYLVFEVRIKFNFFEMQHKLKGKTAVGRSQFSGIKVFVLVPRSGSRNRILPESSE